MDSVSLSQLADEQLDAARSSHNGRARTPCTADTITGFGRR